MKRFILAGTATLAVALTALTVTTLTSQNVLAQSADELPSKVADYALIEAQDDHTIGSEDAAQTLIVWASVTCPHCSDWFTNEWPDIKTELVDTGILRVVFREFPTAPAQMALTGFLLAECAPSADYMSVIEYQMENQKEIFKEAKEGNGRDAYDKIAKLAGMDDEAAVTACLRNPDMLNHIQDNADRATAAKIKGVPAFLINGETYEGDPDAKSLVDLITDMDEKGITALPKGLKKSAPHSDTDSEDHSGHEHD